MIARAGAAARAGVSLIQIREAGLADRALADLVARVLEAVRETKARVVVNDRLDLALAAHAHGVHLKASSFAAARARAMAPEGFLIGRSVHGLEAAVEAARAGDVDYLIAGTVFPSRSKREGHRTLGIEGLGRIAAEVTVPVIAIGGIDRTNVADVGRTPVTGIAAIGWFADEPRAAIIVDAVRRAFDTQLPNAE
jgi:thiamine-phosphate pyrophosphorylase